jgi:hypothetical protein
MTIDYSNIKNVRQASNALELLLLAAKQVQITGTKKEKSAVLDDLETFDTNLDGRPDSAKYADLLDIARDTITELGFNLLTDAVASINKNNAKLQLLTNRIEDLSNMAEADVRKLKLTETVNAVDNLTLSINTFKKIEENVAAPNQSLLEKAKDILKTLKTFKDTLAT